MQPLHPVYFRDGKLFLIEQRLLPGEERHVPYEDPVEVARAIRDLEATPGIRPDQDFWSTAQYRLLRIAGRRFLDLVPPPPR